MPIWKRKQTRDPRFFETNLWGDGSQRLTLLHDAVGPDERIQVETQGKQPLSARVEEDVRILVTDKRLLWIGAHGPLLVQDLAFEDVIACLASEKNLGFVLEADEPRYREMFGSQTTLCFMRLGHFGDPIAVLRLIEDLVPAAARDRLPDMKR